MRAHKLAAIIVAVTIGTLTTSCQKKSGELAFQKVLDQTFSKIFGQTSQATQTNHSRIHFIGKVTIPLNKKNLGVLPLSNHISTTVNLDTNKECTITPTLLQDENVQIILSVQTKNTDGQLESVNVARVLARSGEPFDVFIGDMDLAFTPRLVSQ